MPFDLKNARATYQRLVSQIFAQQIYKAMEVYIDNILVKSFRAIDHLTHLAEMFDVLHTYNMKLNLNKCSFGVFLSNFFKFMISQKSIALIQKRLKQC